MERSQKANLRSKLPYRVILTQRAIKSFERLPQETKERVAKVFDALSQTPVPFTTLDVKKLKGLGSAYRIRIGDWRIIYEYYAKTKTIVIDDILRREKAYG